MMHESPFLKKRLDAQKRLEALNEHWSRQKEVIEDIMEECTKGWIDKFDCSDAKSVPRCAVGLYCSERLAFIGTYQ